ncbi:MAG: 2TM domain-containing protein [Armatimonadetes bacterium]|nr:2TM domain-containing protein [Armatimonadota bacterium]
MATFDPKEAEAILIEAARRESRAATGQTGVSRERLAAMAAELEIAPETLEAVLSEREAKSEDAALRTAFIRERRGAVSSHVVPYVLVCALLIFLWAITGGGHPWFLYPVVGWGFGVVSHIAAAYPTSGTAFEAEFAAFQKKHIRRERDKARRENKRAAKETKSETVKESVQTTDVAKERDWNAPVEPEAQTVSVGRKK